ncbi:MAG: arylsulfatase [Verrucomicrobiaceae bacterium]|nr:MAG: arylsulfatase [Verrucomicrobiaceae bacterium]
MKNLTASILLSLAPLASAADKPNIIVILADDMGFSDLGCYGGEISTPNLDALAAGGVRFSQFYNSARCCPTRASLMTGLHPHQAGIGHMTVEPEGKKKDDVPPAYVGLLTPHSVTIGEALKGAGYSTFITGKWHLGELEKSQWPLQRGFDHFYGCLSGATHYFKPDNLRGITLDNEPDRELKSTTDRPYYTTDAFTDHAIGFIKGTQKPFFLYLAYTAPHWPMQAHEEDIVKYRGKYKAGWDVLRKERYDRQVKMGLIDPKSKLSPRDPQVPAWDSLSPEKQDEMDLRMAIYAAMVDRMDQNVGKLVASLKEQKRFDNTLILFLADNGACAENGVLGNFNIRDVEERNSKWNISYGTAWANLSATPFRLYKHFAHEGGTATPFFAHWPSGVRKRGEWFKQPGQIIDIMPTVLDVSGAKYPEGKPALNGISLKPAFEGSDLKRTKPLFMEHENNAFLRDGDWKLVGRDVAPKDGLKAERWQLYNIAEDRTELKNLAKEMPDKVKEMSAQWSEWAEKTKVYPK